jgi:hypothetical protein
MSRRSVSVSKASKAATELLRQPAVAGWRFFLGQQFGGSVSVVLPRLADD